MKNILKFFIPFFISVGLVIAGYTVVKTQKIMLANDNQKATEYNNKLEKEIDKIGNTSQARLKAALDYYKTYFKKRSQLYILDVFGLLEYVIPDNNFVEKVTLKTKSLSTSLTFKSKEIGSLVKLYYNLENVKKLGLIEKYSFQKIDLENQGNGLLDGEEKKYKVGITLSPNIKNDNEEIVEFLSKTDKVYKWIYDVKLRKIKCNKVMVDGKEICKSDKELKMEKEQKELENKKQQKNNSNTKKENNSNSNTKENDSNTNTKKDNSNKKEKK